MQTLLLTSAAALGAILFALSPASADTIVDFQNNCTTDVSVFQTLIDGSTNTICTMQPAVTCSKSFDNSQGAMNFRNTAAGKTIAEFGFQQPGDQDNYALNVINGFDVPLMIQPSTGGPVAECGSADCTDAYHSSTDNHTHGTPQGGVFTVTFCYTN